jgi:hypothetical protein
MRSRLIFQRRLLLLASLLCGLATMPMIAEEPPARKPVPPDHAKRMKESMQLFTKHVRPVLTEQCLKCHGGEAIKGDFDLSSREKLMDSGMVGDDAASSHLYAVISHAEEPFMPKDGEKLSDVSLAHIARWLDLGAAYDRPLIERDAGRGPSAISQAERSFWSFQPLADVAPPASDDPWARSAVDRFILARQREMGLAPNGMADRRTLIRRAYFDLLGIPPTPAEVAEFLGDADPMAYEKLLDRLLESPRYGERWARHWMDIARFAESHGYEQDYDRPHAYHYRDFLIRALNDDMPYDQFVRWQIAGDELAPDDPLALMATGFLGSGVFPTQLTEMEFESARYDELDDMVGTLGTAVLGLSVGCARCHDHKFDPIPAADYYRMVATFTTTIRSEVDLDLHPQENAEKLAAFTARRDALQRELERFEREEIPAALKSWLTDYDPSSAQADPWLLLTEEAVSAGNGSTFERQSDGSWLAQGAAPDKETITVRGVYRGPAVTGVRLEALTHDSLPQKGPGRAPNGNFALGDVRLTLSSGANGEETQAVTLASARATHEQNKDSLSVAASLDNDPTSGWAVDQGGIGKDQAAVFLLEQPLAAEQPQRLTLTLDFQHPNAKHSLGRFRISLTSLADPRPEVGRSETDANTRAALASLKADWNSDSDAYRTAAKWFAERQSGWLQRKKELQDHVAAGPGLTLTKVQVTSEGFPPTKHHADDRGFPHFYPETHFLMRGDVHQKKEAVESSYLQVLMPQDYDAKHWQVTPPPEWTRTSFRRAGMAAWLTDTQQGAGQLAARVIANRLWQHHFGQGIVATPSDFGAQGELPTHPELLDWLARDLIDHGWRLKRMHKLLMTSAVYMQTSEYDEQRAAVDRENRFHWRRTPQRLEAEAIRDSLLSVSGLLDTTMYGPGTLDQNMRRRSIYFFIKRSQLIPMMMLFDWPEHLVGIGQRSTTTIAPQALAFMNNPQFRQYAEGFARRLEGHSREAAIAEAYRIAFGREPGETELQLGSAFLDRQTAVYRDAGKDAADFSGLVDYCQMLMSSNEFIYVE